MAVPTPTTIGNRHKRSAYGKNLRKNATDFRMEAKKHQKRYDELTNQIEELLSGDPPQSKEAAAQMEELREEQQMLREMIDAANRQAAKHFFAANNFELPRDWVDLNDLYLDEAIGFAEEKTSELLHSPDTIGLAFVLGPGGQSVTPQHELKSALAALAEKWKLSFLDNTSAEEFNVTLAKQSAMIYIQSIPKTIRKRSQQAILETAAPAAVAVIDEYRGTFQKGLRDKRVWIVGCFALVLLWLLVQAYAMIV